MRSAILTATLTLLLSATPLFAQKDGESPWRLGMAWRAASGHQVGPELQRVLSNGSVNTRVDFSVLARVANAKQLAFYTPGPDNDGRTARAVGALTLSAELGPRKDGRRTWYALAGAGAEAVLWDAGTFATGTPPWRVVDPEGTTAIGPVFHLGLGRDFELLGTLVRSEFRIERHQDRVAPVDGFRLAFSRSW